MSKSFRPLLTLVLVLVLASVGCVRPRSSPTPPPTKTSLHPPTAATVATVVVPTATLAVTPEPTAEPTAEATPTTESTTPVAGEGTYQVRWGDTLSRIAQAHGTTVQAIMAVNPGVTDPTMIYAGMVLVMPGGSTTPPVTQPSGPSTTTTYVVQWGDTLYRIAVRYGTTEEAIMAANPSITDPTKLYAGMKLVIPTSGATAARTHVVRAGDTLSSVAQMYGTTVLAIMQANNLPDSNTIYAGQVLVIP